MRISEVVDYHQITLRRREATWGIGFILSGVYREFWSGQFHYGETSGALLAVGRRTIGVLGGTMGFSKVEDPSPLRDCVLSLRKKWLTDAGKYWLASTYRGHLVPMLRDLQKFMRAANDMELLRGDIPWGRPQFLSRNRISYTKGRALLAFYVMPPGISLPPGVGFLMDDKSRIYFYQKTCSVTVISVRNT